MTASLAQVTCGAEDEKGPRDLSRCQDLLAEVVALLVVAGEYEAIKSVPFVSSVIYFKGYSNAEYFPYDAIGNVSGGW
ncbi:unnamed protein product [Agarophyton chilense]